MWTSLLDSGLLSADAEHGELVAPISPPGGEREHQFLVLLKPELFEPTVDVVAVLDLIAKRLEGASIVASGIRWFTGRELRASGAIERHYGVINDISRRGSFALSAGAAARLGRTYGEASACALGGHQVLERSSGSVDASSLQLAFQAADVVRLGPGAYAAWVEVGSEPLLVLNGFHPAQVEHFTKDGARTVAIEARSDRSWRALRTEVAGTTDPATATSGSIRAELRCRAADLGLADVSVGRNGVHVSAGPIEGCAEILRFFDGIDHHDLVLGNLLTQLGYHDDQTRAVLNNPTLSEGRTVFDATEELDLQEAIAVVSESGAMGG